MVDFLGGPICWGDLHRKDNWEDLILLGGPKTPLYTMFKLELLLSVEDKLLLKYYKKTVHSTTHCLFLFCWSAPKTIKL